MQQYLAKQRKNVNKNPSDCLLRKLRSQLEVGVKLPQQDIKKALQADRMGTTRQLLLFGKYNQSKKMIHKYVTLQQITDDRQLSILFSQTIDSEQSTNKKVLKKGEEKQQKGWLYRRDRLIKVCSIVVGVLLFIVVFIKRKQVSKIVNKILV